MVLLEEEVRKSFARVKEDITQVKRSLNKQLFSIESMSKTLGVVLPKDEFYTFVQRLGSKIEELETDFATKSERSDVEGIVFELRKEISAVRKLVEQREGIADELRQVRSLKGKLLELEGLSVSKPEFSKEMAKLKADLSGLKSASSGEGTRLHSLSSSLSEFEKSLSALTGEVSTLKADSAKGVDKASSLSSSLSKLEKSLAALASRVNSLSASAVVKEETAAFTDRIESSHQEAMRKFSSLKLTMDRKAADFENKLSLLGSAEEKLSSLSGKLSGAEDAVAALDRAVNKKFVDRNAFEKAIGELSSKVNETRQVLESSISEVSIEDYVTKRSLKQQLAAISESLNSALSSSFSSKVSDIEGRLAELKRELDSAIANADKKLGKEIEKFAPSKELKKLSDEFGRLASSFVTVEDFNSRTGKMHDSSAASSDDLKREIRRQRELFEERLKSLESYYRSSNDTIKAELEQVRSQIKGLTKADAEAKSEIAKVSVSASKAAAKTAAEILEEIETESGSGRRGKGLSPLAVSLIIIALLVVGSIAYVALKGPGAMEAAENAIPFIINASVPPASAQVGNATQPPGTLQPQANESVNASPILPVVSNISNITEVVAANVSVEVNATVPATAANLTINASPANISLPVDRDQACKDRLECTNRADGEYWFDCYFDPSLDDCRCFVGTADNCPGLELKEAGTNISAESPLGETGKSPGARYYGIVAFVILVVAFFAYRTLFARESEEGSRRAKGEKAEKAKKPDAKGTGKSEGGEGDEEVIDLEEFFEKKNSKKK